MNADKFRLKVYFDGHVQGVGFRYKACQVAKSFEVTGTVSNLDDGKVLLEAYGKESEVRDFVEELSSLMKDFIRTRDERADLVESAPRGFNIVL